MKRSVIILSLLFSALLGNAQMATVDAAANAQIKGSNALTKAISALSKVQASINNDALFEAIKTAETVRKQFELVNQVYSVASGINNLKRVKDFFIESAITAQAVTALSTYLAQEKNSISEKDRSTVKMGLDLSIDELKLAFETMQFALSPANKLSVSERLKEFENSNQSLNRAIDKLQEGKMIVYRAKAIKEKRDKANYYYNLKYDIKN